LGVGAAGNAFFEVLEKFGKRFLGWRVGLGLRLFRLRSWYLRRVYKTFGLHYCFVLGNFFKVLYKLYGIACGVAGKTMVGVGFGVNLQLGLSSGWKGQRIWWWRSGCIL